MMNGDRQSSMRVRTYVRRPYNLKEKLNDMVDLDLMWSMPQRIFFSDFLFQKTKPSLSPFFLTMLPCWLFFCPCFMLPSQQW